MQSIGSAAHARVYLVVFLEEKGLNHENNSICGGRSSGYAAWSGHVA
jgi:hypothetical protein